MGHIALDAYFSSWHFIRVVLPRLCARSPPYFDGYSLARSVVIQATAQGYSTYSPMLVSGSVGAQLSPIVSGIPLCTCLPITPTVQYRGGSYLIVLAFVGIVQFLAVLREFVCSLKKSDYCNCVDTFKPTQLDIIRLLPQ